MKEDIRNRRIPVKVLLAALPSIYEKLFCLKELPDFQEEIDSYLEMNNLEPYFLDMTIT